MSNRIFFGILLNSVHNICNENTVNPMTNLKNGSGEGIT